jgi:hypothetical protein
MASNRQELHYGERLACGPRRNPKELHADNTVVLIEIENHPRTHLLGLDDLILIEPKVERVAFLIHLDSKSGLLSLRSSKHLSAKRRDSSIHES